MADGECRISLFFGNTIYLIALCYYTVISFLGYNGTTADPPCGRSLQLTRSR